MTRIAFATSAAYAALTDDDRLAIPPLRARGVDASPAVWDAPDVPWESFDAVVLRSTWDYHRRAAAFAAWLDTLAARGVAVLNPPALVRWNMDKRYLADLAARGVPVPPTAWLRAGERVELAAVLAAAGWDEGVVKPCVSATAEDTWRTSPALAPAQQEVFAALLARKDLMVQPFLHALARDGEWSLVFLGGAFSHAVRKRPAPGDFRVQSEHGGTAETADAPAWLVAAARAALDARPSGAAAPALYARVDGVVERDGDGAPRFVLMELECVEPSLFLGASSGAPERFAAAITEALGRA